MPSLIFDVCRLAGAYFAAFALTNRTKSSIRQRAGGSPPWGAQARERTQYEHDVSSVAPPAARQAFRAFPLRQLRLRLDAR
jgi:hypothetical protein